MQPPVARRHRRAPRGAARSAGRSARAARRPATDCATSSSATIGGLSSCCGSLVADAGRSRSRPPIAIASGRATAISTSGRDARAGARGDGVGESRSANGIHRGLDTTSALQRKHINRAADVWSLDRHHRGATSARIDAERVEPLAQRVAVDAQRAGGAQLVAAMARQHRLDQRAFDLADDPVVERAIVERVRAPRARAARAGRAPPPRSPGSPGSAPARRRPRPSIARHRRRHRSVRRG